MDKKSKLFSGRVKNAIAPNQKIQEIKFKFEEINLPLIF